MKIINVVENTEGRPGCATEHGLSFYIETEKHRLLMDTGASDLLLRNMGSLGIDPGVIDTVVLSHGHYDHGGGILSFARENDSARIYIHKKAFAERFSERGGTEPEYVGLNPAVADLPQVYLTEGSVRIDEELSVFDGIGRSFPVPDTNRSLKKKTDRGYEEDDFVDEQCLVVRQGGRSWLFSGCAHHGILNIIERYIELYGSAPYAAVSGFHLMRRSGAYTERDREINAESARRLLAFPTKFYTCHCTGMEPFAQMKEIMGQRLEYVHCGEEIMV